MSLVRLYEGRLYHMLLFSTVLDIKDSITPDDFIQLVIKWNNTSTHTENIVTGIEWQGERTARYGDDRLWLEFDC